MSVFTTEVDGCKVTVVASNVAYVIDTAGKATVIADSVHAETGTRITTMELVYPRFIHSEFMTHRILNRNASSSRAIPTSKFIEQVRNEPVMPSHWGRNQKGMQAAEELD